MVGSFRGSNPKPNAGTIAVASPRPTCRDRERDAEEAIMRGSRRTMALATVAVLLGSACKETPTKAANNQATAGEDREAPAPVAEAIKSLQSALGKELKSQIKSGGPVAAIGVCNEQAPKLTAAQNQPGLRIGRTSHKLRNPGNEAPAWARGAVAAAADQKMAQVQKRHVFDLGEGRIGYLEAIGTAPICLTCHGAQGVVAEDVRSQIAALYPQDRATGFAEGDLRGWFWAEWSPAVQGPK